MSAGGDPKMFAAPYPSHLPEKTDLSEEGVNGGAAGAAASDASEQELMRKRVFVGNLPRTVTPEKLKEFLSQHFGAVTETNIVRDRENDTSKGYGFVTFSSEEQANRCVQKKNLTFMNRQLNFGPAKRKEKQAMPPKSPSQQQNPGRPARFGGRDPQFPYMQYPQYNVMSMPMYPQAGGYRAEDASRQYYPVDVSADASQQYASQAMMYPMYAPYGQPVMQQAPAGFKASPQPLADPSAYSGMYMPSGQGYGMAKHMPLGMPQQLGMKPNGPHDDQQLQGLTQNFNNLSTE